MTRQQYFARNRREILKRGLVPVKARWDENGDCLICGEAGRCPGWHTQEELRKSVERNGQGGLFP